jgi:hypothetical protein
MTQSNGQPIAAVFKVWDHDLTGKDFLGGIALSRGALKEAIARAAAGDDGSGRSEARRTVERSSARRAFVVVSSVVSFSPGHSGFVDLESNWTDGGGGGFKPPQNGRWW